MAELAGPEYFRLDEHKYTEFSPHVVDVGDIQFKGNPDSLARFPQWVWYTIAAPVLWGGLDNKVLAAIQQETGLTYHKKVFEKPIFDGFGPPWDYLLWAVPQIEWPSLKEEFLAVTNVSVEEKVFIKYGLQELAIYDPLAVDRGAITAEGPTMHLYAFGIMSNRKTIAFNPAQKLVERPRVYTFKPDDEIVTLSRRVLAGQSDFDGVIEQIADRKTKG